MLIKKKIAKKKKKADVPTMQEELILSTYDMLDDDDISTERLLCLVADACNCDIDDVTDVLVRFK